MAQLFLSESKTKSFNIIKINVESFVCWKISYFQWAISVHPEKFKNSKLNYIHSVLWFASNIVLPRNYKIFFQLKFSKLNNNYNF